MHSFIIHALALHCAFARTESDLAVQYSIDLYSTFYHLLQNFMDVKPRLKAESCEWKSSLMFAVVRGCLQLLRC